MSGRKIVDVEYRCGCVTGLIGGAAYAERCAKHAKKITERVAEVIHHHECDCEHALLPVAETHGPTVRAVLAVLSGAEQ